MERLQEILCVMSLGLTSVGCGTVGSDDTDAGPGTEASVETGTNSESGDGDPGDGDPGDGDPGDGDPGDGDPGDGDGDEQKFDTLTTTDTPLDCGDPVPAAEFSLVWVANAEQGTISKIDSKTVTEIGRYVARPDSAGSPSRTSVSSSGHVAVANRNGGVTKIYADEQFCEDSNGMPGIQTSSDDQALAWGTEECVAWHKPMAYLSQRPVAWARGELDESCAWQNEELWTSGTNGQVIDVYVLDGADGATKEMVSIEGVDPQYFGIYGAAIDGNGDLWGSQLGGGKLIRVNRADMTYDVWDTPPSGFYGMTVDAEGFVYLCGPSVARFDPDLETFDVADVGGMTGCMAEAPADGLLWIANLSGVVGVNRDTLQVDKQWPVPDGAYGVSIDFEGYIWAISFGNTASKINSETGQIWTYQGLVGAYTYSDMTGYALANVGP